MLIAIEKTDVKESMLNIEDIFGKSRKKLPSTFSERYNMIRRVVNYLLLTAFGLLSGKQQSDTIRYIHFSSTPK